MKEQIKQVNHLLEAGESANISVDTFSGYVGYKPQSIVDAMNQVFDIGAWGFSEISSEIVGGEKGQLALSNCQVWLKDIEFKPTSWGQSNVTRGAIGDAKKGAQTDAIKKALSYFSIGNRAYLGLLKEDGTSDKQQQKPSQPQQPRQIVQAASNASKPVQTMPVPSQEHGATEPQKESIRKLCAMLKQPEPIVASYDEAKLWIAKLSKQYSESRKAS